jgi:hypothetical protein
MAAVSSSGGGGGDAQLRTTVLACQARIEAALLAGPGTDGARAAELGDALDTLAAAAMTYAVLLDTRASKTVKDVVAAKDQLPRAVVARAKALLLAWKELVPAAVVAGVGKPAAPPVPAAAAAAAATAAPPPPLAAAAAAAAAGKGHRLLHFRFDTYAAPAPRPATATAPVAVAGSTPAAKTAAGGLVPLALRAAAAPPVAPGATPALNAAVPAGGRDGIDGCFRGGVWCVQKRVLASCSWAHPRMARFPWSSAIPATTPGGMVVGPYTAAY